MYTNERKCEGRSGADSGRRGHSPRQTRPKWVSGPPLMEKVGMCTGAETVFLLSSQELHTIRGTVAEDHTSLGPMVHDSATAPLACGNSGPKADSDHDGTHTLLVGRQACITTHSGRTSRGELAP